MARTRRERQYAATLDEIKATARQVMLREGSAGLSLREIARTMGMTAPALYHYFPNRDALVTALIVDAFNALADALEQARVGTPGPAAAQLLAAMHAYRAWALAHPADFGLIYGNPIPGYEAPRDATVPAAARSLRVFVTMIGAALASGELQPAPAYQSVPPGLAAHLAELPLVGAAAGDLRALYLATLAWPRIHGSIMLELFNHLQPVVGDTAAFYQIQAEDLLRGFGLVI